jgi:hypothetical protein
MSHIHRGDNRAGQVGSDKFDQKIIGTQVGFEST